MKFTLSWLNQHLSSDPIEDNLSDLLDAMTMAGLEVEHVHNPAEKLRAFTLAHVISTARHQNADKLQVCQVDTVDGRKEIVCGAPNVRAGLYTVYAPIGAYVPGLNVTLEAKPVRGIVSNGMLCSAAELELDTESDGIMEVDDGHPDFRVGQPIATLIGLDDPMIDFEVTPNRPDWLGVQGIARDLAARGLGSFKPGKVKAVKGKFASPIAVHLAEPEACPYFAGRLIRGVKNGPSPVWLQERLKSIGLKPISALVDVTNYLSYDRARPLHVFDAARLTGDITVRLAREGEILPALDGKTYTLLPDMCVVTDASGPLALGGVMGGMASGCTPETVDVFIESAWFDPGRTGRTGRALNLLSDARTRFERGVDPESVLDGLELATRLILDACGGEPSELVVAGSPPSRRTPVNWSPGFMAKLSGFDIAASRQKQILRALGFTITTGAKGEPWSVAPPSWRRDVDGPADIVEELLRIEGFDLLPATPLPKAEGRVKPVVTPLQNLVRIGRRVIAARGYAEAITWSFCDRATATAFGGGAEALVLANPIASELDCMRPSALIHLIHAGQRNANLGREGARLFEAGPIYLGDGPNDQRTVIAAILRPDPARHWQAGGTEDVFSVKADLLALLEALGQPADKFMVMPAEAAYWHPGRSASLRLGPKAVVARFGALHPRVLKALDCEGDVFGFELILDALPQAKAKAGKTRPALSPANLTPIKRDFAFLVEDGIAADKLIRATATALKAGTEPADIIDVRLFDVYRGQGVPEGKASLAIEVSLQPRERALKDAEIEQICSLIVGAVSKATGANLRG